MKWLSCVDMIVASSIEIRRLDESRLAPCSFMALTIAGLPLDGSSRSNKASPINQSITQIPELTCKAVKSCLWNLQVYHLVIIQLFQKLEIITLCWRWTGTGEPCSQIKANHKHVEGIGDSLVHELSVWAENGTKRFSVQQLSHSARARWYAAGAFICTVPSSSFPRNIKLSCSRSL
jgi:hypothetical protein